MINGKLCLGFMPHGTGSAYPFNSIFPLFKDVLKEGTSGIDCLVLWGGEDISPVYYNEKPHYASQSKQGPTTRDRNEWAAMQWAYKNKIPIIGVCRGAQFLCVFSGGKLIQHVDGHHKTHNVMCSDRTDLLETSSCHHQMMYPYDLKDYQLLAWSSFSQSTKYEGEDSKAYTDMHSRFEPEVVYFPQTKGLAIQGHPEWMGAKEPFVEYLLEKVDTLLLTKSEPVLEFA